MTGRRLKRLTDAVRGTLGAVRAVSTGLIVFFVLGGAAQSAAAEQQPTLAVVATDPEMAPLADLLTAQLSQEGVKLVERQQLDAVLQEQALSAAGLTDRANLVKVGQLVRADAFVLLSMEKGTGTSASSLLRVRVAETAHGIRLLDALEAWNPHDPQGAAAALSGRLKSLVEKLKLPAGQLIAVSIMRLQSAGGLPAEDEWLAEGLTGALSARFAADPRVVVLEREDLDLLRQEKDLTAGAHGSFWGAAVLVDGNVGQGRKDKSPTLALEVLDARGATRGSAIVPVPPDDPLSAVQAAAKKLLPRLTHASAAGTFASASEAEEFHRRAQALIFMRIDPTETVSLLATAHALAPRNVRYGMDMYHFQLTHGLKTGHLEAARAALKSLEAYVDAIIASGNPTVLESWDVVPDLTSFPDYDSDVEVAGQWYKLLQKVRSAVAAHPDNRGSRSQVRYLDSCLMRLPDRFRARLVALKRRRDELKAQGDAADAELLQRLIDRYLKALPPLAKATARLRVRVRMLLSAKDWPAPWDWRSEGWPFAWVQWRDGRIWIAMTDNSREADRMDSGFKVGLVALDPERKGPVSLWQVTARSRNTIEGLEGFVLGEAHSYVTLAGSGILVLPGTAVRGEGLIQDARRLGPADGLPVRGIHAIAGTPEQMWVGYGMERDYGLGIFNALTGRWKHCLTDVRARNTPLIRAMPGGALFSGEAGLWYYDLHSGRLRQVERSNIFFLSAGTAEEPWFKNDNTLLYLDMKDKTVEMALQPDSIFTNLTFKAGWPVRRNVFAPADKGHLLGAWRAGYVDLTTAAIHGDYLWARSGRTQIVILHRGQKVADAQKIDNDILDGGPVLQFFETPYGLLAVGEGSAGIVETGSAGGTAD